MKGYEGEERMKKIKPSAVLGTLACIVFIPIIIINLVIIINGFSDTENIPGFFGYRMNIVLSGSMSPTFDAGDAVIIENVENTENLQKGDVITYLVSGKATTHRIISVTEHEGKVAYITKGDYNNVEDRLAVYPEQIQGIYKGFHIPKLGNIMMFMQSTQGMMICLGVPFALYIIYDLIVRRKERKEEHSERDEQLKEKERLEEELAKLRAEKQQMEESN